MLARAAADNGRREFHRTKGGLVICRGIASGKGQHTVPGVVATNDAAHVGELKLVADGEVRSDDDRGASEILRGARDSDSDTGIDGDGRTVDAVGDRSAASR